MAQVIRTLLNQNPISNPKDLLDAIIPLLKLLTLTAIGSGLSYFHTLPKSTFKLLSKLVFALFLPCLIFINLGQSITLEDFINWWFIPVNVLISTFLGCLLGYFVVHICHSPPELRRFVIIFTGFGNMGNLAIAIVHSVCHSSDNPFGPNCQTKGVAYVSFAQWVSVILTYTFVYHMMEPPLEYYEIVQDTGIEEQCLRTDASSPLLVEAEWPGVDERGTEPSKSAFIVNVSNESPESSEASSFELESAEGSSRGEPTGCFLLPKMVRKIRIVAEQTPIEHILQPPTIASLLAIVVGIVPHLKGFVFGHDAPLSVVTDSLEILAGAMVPAVMLVLGGMLAEGPNESKLGLRTTIGVTVARLVVLPLFGVGIVSLAIKLNLVVFRDKMYIFVIFLQYTTPSAILLGAIASLRGYAVREASALLFWQHVFALISLSVYVVMYFKLMWSM